MFDGVLHVTRTWLPWRKCSPSSATETRSTGSIDAGLRPGVWDVMLAALSNRH